MSVTLRSFAPILALTLLALVPAMPQAQEQATLKPVKIVTAATVNPEMTRQFFGQVVARQTVDLAFQVGGQILDFPVTEGAVLAQGQLVAQLDLETFELSLKQAQVQRDQAARTLDRLKRQSANTASQVRIDDAQTQLSLADVALKNAEYGLKHATLSAPFDALVAARNVANFTTIGAGTPVVRLHDMSEVRIEVDVPEVLFLSQQANNALDFKARFPSSDQLFDLQLREFNAETTKVGQSFRVTFGMQPPEGLRILPGASVTVTIKATDSNLNGVILPKQAVFIDADGKTAVMAFTPQTNEVGSLKKLLVEVVPAPNNAVLVVSGLEPGVQVVAAGGAVLQDNQTVRRFAGFGN